MSAISLKSITGITSITTPTGVDNQLTLHTNDTTQRVKVTQSGIEVVGVATFQDIDVDGHTNLDNVSIAGVTTAQAFQATTGTFTGDVDIASTLCHSGDTDTKISFATNTIKFDTDTEERLRITSTGLVHTKMTGTAPSWLGDTIATREKFSVFQGANFAEACFNIDVDNNNSFLSHNMYYSSGWRIKKTGQPVRHLEIGTNGWRFMTGADGANDAISALTERLRITADGAIGLGGANYGTSGQVLTSGGSGSAVSWTTIAAQANISNNADNRIITGGSGVNLNGESSFTYDGNGGLDMEGTGSAFFQIKTANNTDGGVYFRTGSTNPGAVSYLHTDNSMSFRINSTTKLKIDSDGQVSIKSSTTAFDGTGDLDALQLYYETDSGQASIGPYSSGGSTHLSFYTNAGGAAASEKLRIDSAGNLHIKGTDHATRYYRDDGARYGSVFYDGSNFVLQQPNGDNLQIEKFDGTILHKFNTSGDLSVGHDSPQRKLHVKSGANNNNGAFRVESSSGNIMDMGTDSSMHFLNCVNNDPFRIKFAGNEALRITDERSGNSTVTLQFGLETNSNQGATPYIRGVCGTEADGSDAENAGGFEFHSKTGGSGTDINAMKISHNGRVSIGAHNIQAPTAALHIIGDTQGTNTALQVGQDSSARYFRVNEIPGQSNFLECVLSYYDNTLANLIKLQNTYAGAANFGTAIQFIGHGGSQTGRIAVKNRDVNSASNSIMELEASYVTKPNQPLFLTYSTGTTLSANNDNVLAIGSTYQNVGGHYKTSGSDQGKFIAPVAGIYWFYCMYTAENSVSGPVISFKVNGSHTQNFALNYNATYDGTFMGQTISLNANDYVQCSMRDWNGQTPNPWNTWWGGWLQQ